MAWDNEYKERHETFCKAFGIKVGDTIDIPSWFSYEVVEDGFKTLDGRMASTACSYIMNRGFTIRERKNSKILAYEYKVAYRLWLDDIKTTKYIRHQGFYNITSDMWDRIEEILVGNYEKWEKEMEERYREGEGRC